MIHPADSGYVLIALGRSLMKKSGESYTPSHTSQKFFMINIDKPSRAVPVTPPTVGVRTGRFGSLSSQDN